MDFILLFCLFFSDYEYTVMVHKQFLVAIWGVLESPKFRGLMKTAFFFYCTPATKVNIAAKISAYFLRHQRVLDVIPEYVPCL